MQAEVAHLPDAAAQAFARGCLWAAIKSRAATAAFIRQATQWVLVLGAIGWSAGNLWLAGRLSVAGAAEPAQVARVSAAIYAAGAVLTAWLGLRATVVFAIPMLMLVGAISGATEVLLPASPYARLYHALALEQSALLAVVILIATGVPIWLAVRERSFR
jgi:hypothetical protein